MEKLTAFACISVSVLLAVSGVRANGEGQAVGQEDSRVKRSDDTGLASLEVLVQQQAAALQALQARVTAMENKQPASFQPVAFSVRFSQDDGQHGIALGHHTTLLFDTVLTNLGHGYDPQTGLFTAPVAGLYVFFLSAMSTSAHRYLKLTIAQQGKPPLDMTYAEGSTDPGDQGSTQVTTHLSVGEQVWVRQEAGDAVRGSFWTIFTGFLVQAD